MDRHLYRWMNALADHTPWAHGALRLYADAGVAVFAVLLLVAYLDARRAGDARRVAGACWSGAAVLAALGIAQVIGGAVGRLRPYAVMADVHVLVHRTTDVTFPSDHATMAGAAAAGLWLVDRRWGRPAAVAAVLMAVTRVYVGAHYPSDVVAGLALGAAVAVAGHRLVVPTAARFVAGLARTPLRPAVAAGRS